MCAQGGKVLLQMLRAKLQEVRRTPDVEAVAVLTWGKQCGRWHPVFGAALPCFMFTVLLCSAGLCCDYLYMAGGIHITRPILILFPTC